MLGEYKVITDEFIEMYRQYPCKYIIKRQH